MFPWIWLYAPNVSWPLSGAVDVSLDAFFRGIQPGAGVPAIEKRVFEQASYGKQLGWLTDVVVDALGPETLTSAEAKGSLTSCPPRSRPSRTSTNKIAPPRRSPCSIRCKPRAPKS
jgi:hypothetical protein